MMDSNGSNTTAAAAVLAAAKHVDLSQSTALVLAATGPVGQRVARLLARQGANVRAASRSVARAQEACSAVAAVVADAKLTACETSTTAGLQAALDGAEVVIAAGAAGIELMPAGARAAARSLRVAVDLNAVPPAGIGGIDVMDKAAERDGALCYGAIGVGGLKMKIHKAAIRALFESNDRVLDAEEIYAIGQSLGAS
jgi:saccharopine dehydrogenase-like NADP-dependent oxidoreductase